MHFLLLLLCLLAPAALIWLTHHYHWANKLGIVVLCYMTGLAAGNLGLIPAAASGLQTTVTELSIALAMPLLLFSLDIRQWVRVAGKAILSMLLATTSVISLATCLFFLFDTQGMEAAEHFAAMSVGVYTGGTPNLAAIKSGLAIPNEQYLVFHSLDTLAGSFYLLFMLTVGIRFFRAALPTTAATEISHNSEHLFTQDNYAPLLQRENRGQLITAVTLAALVVLSAAAVEHLYSHFVSATNGGAVMIVAITTLGILLSLIRRVRTLQLSYDIGMYLIYVFCFVVSSMASLELIADIDWSVALFLLGTLTGSVLLHALLCKLMGVDADTFIVTSVAAIASPPFVPLIARALDNPGAILTGITTGIIGYALGNYLGISLGLVLKNL